MRPLIVLLALGAAALAQSLEERLEKELQKPFVKKIAWEMDFDKALARAEKEKKLVFGYFTRSYAP